MKEKIYTTQEIADELKCARITIIKWCEKNNVEFTGEGRRKTYLITEEDKNKFKSRNSSKGRPKK